LGTFYYPLKVYNNISFVETNSNYYNRQGYSEIYKYALLDSKEFLDEINMYLGGGQKNPARLFKIIELTIEARSNIRQKDALASNLGHTFGHALEKITDFKVMHGDAIWVGTVMALYFGL
jgi:3-dehydroquinate synthase